MESKLEHIVRNLKECFDGKPWYGISVMEKLNTLDWRYVNLKPSGSSKSVAVLLAHMIRWRIFVLRKLGDDADFDIKIDTEDDWPKTRINSEKEWKAMLNGLQKTQNELIRYVSDSDENFLNGSVPNRDYDFHFLIKGIAEHDIYHLGQIALLYSLVKSD